MVNVAQTVGSSHLEMVENNVGKGQNAFTREGILKTNLVVSAIILGPNISPLTDIQWKLSAPIITKNAISLFTFCRHPPTCAFLHMS